MFVIVSCDVVPLGHWEDVESAPAGATPATGDGAEEQAGEDDDECGIASLISLFAGKAPKAKATKQVKPQASSPAKPTVPKRASTATSVPPAKKTKGAGAAARTAPTAAAGKENIAENANAANAADDVEQQGEAEAAAAVEAQPIRKRGRKQPDQMETEDKKALEELENELEENHFLEPTSPDDFTFYTKVQKAFSKLHTKYSNKIRQLQRRRGENNATQCLFDKFGRKLKLAIDIVKAFASQDGDSLNELLTANPEIPIKMNNLGYMHRIKLLAFADLAAGRWDAMEKNTFPMLKNLHASGVDKGNMAKLIITTMFQRLLKGKGSVGVVSAKALSCRSVDFVRDYIKKIPLLAEGLLPATDVLFEDAALIHALLEADSKLPGEVAKAVALARATTGKSAAAEHPLLAVIASLPCGKQLVDLAGVAAENRKELSDMDAVQEKLNSLPVGADLITLDTINELQATQTNVADVDAKYRTRADLRTARKELLGKMQDKLSEAMNAHIKLELLPFTDNMTKIISDTLTAGTSTFACDLPPSWPIRKLEINSVPLKMINTYHDSIALIAKSLNSLSVDEAETTQSTISNIAKEAKLLCTRNDSVGATVLGEPCRLSLRKFISTVDQVTAAHLKPVAQKHLDDLADHFRRFLPLAAADSKAALEDESLQSTIAIASAPWIEVDGSIWFDIFCHIVYGSCFPFVVVLVSLVFEARYFHLWHLHLQTPRTSWTQSRPLPSWLKALQLPTTFPRMLPLLMSSRV